MDSLRFLLFPFAVLYDLITGLRNHLYSAGQKRSFRFETMVISVGNLSVGGSGKSPMVEYLIGLLKPDHHLATLSRGYGRKTKGIRFAGQGESASTLGDEPFQFELKFGPEVKVVVGEERAIVIPEILHRYPEIDIVVLDDAYQHRTVDPQLSILLTEYHRPFYLDHVLPMGRLRESRKGAKRADVIVMTKCPDDIDDITKKEIEQSIRRYSGTKPIFFSSIVYQQPVGFNTGSAFQRNVILVSGIANAKPFEEYATSSFRVLRHFKFGDHHVFSHSDLDSILGYWHSLNEKPAVITTEKDYVRLMSLQSHEAIRTLPWFFIPIKIQFLKNGPDFDKIVVQSLEKSKKAG